MVLCFTLDAIDSTNDGKPCHHKDTKNTKSKDTKSKTL